MNETAKKAMAFALSFIIVFSIIFYWFAGVQAAIPKKLTIQGRLDQSGSLADGNFAMVFKIYDQETGGTALYTESHTGSNKVEVKNGFFKTTLGDITALDLDFDVPYWLGITIESDSEISPRIVLNSSSYAMKAGGLALDENLNIDNGTFFVDISNNKVGIGSTTPGYKLDVSGIVNATQYYQGGSPLVSGYWTQSGNDIYYNDGNVGIGTTSPGAKLQLLASESEDSSSSSVIFQNPFEASADYTPPYPQTSMGFQMKRRDTGEYVTAGKIKLFATEDFGDNLRADTSMSFCGMSNSSFGCPLTVYNGIRVGIGTASPYSLLAVGSKSEFQVDSSGNVTTDGNVGIGTTSPGAKLDVRGDVRYGSNGAHIKRAFYRYYTTANVDNQYIHLKTNQPLNNIMTTIKFYGYEFGGSKTIDAQISYYPYSPSGGPTHINATGTHTLGVYLSSDGYIVLTIYVSSTYYTGFYLDAFGPGPQGLFGDIAITASTYSSSATGVY